MFCSVEVYGRMVFLLDVMYERSVTDFLYFLAGVSVCGSTFNCDAALVR